jgi:taurine transport system permease protein
MTVSAPMMAEGPRAAVIAGRGAGWREGWLAIGVGVLSVVAFVLVWQALVMVGLIDPAFFGSPETVANAAWKLIANDSLYKNVKVSAGRVLIGFALSTAVAVPLGLAIGVSRALKAAFDPVISIIRPLPSLSWIPLSMMWLGIGETQKYAIVFMGTLAPTLVFVIDATERVDPLLTRAARNLGANGLQVLWEVILPGALPSILSALKVTMALAWACIISAEMVGAISGLGFLIWNAKDWANINQVIVGMLTISATVLVLDIAYRGAERALLPWRRHERRR